MGAGGRTRKSRNEDSGEKTRGKKKKRGNSEGSDGERQDCIKFVVGFGEKSEEMDRINPLKFTKILNNMVVNRARKSAEGWEFNDWMCKF